MSSPLLGARSRNVSPTICSRAGSRTLSRSGAPNEPSPTANNSRNARFASTIRRSRSTTSKPSCIAEKIAFCPAARSPACRSSSRCRLKISSNATLTRCASLAPSTKNVCGRSPRPIWRTSRSTCRQGAIHLRQTRYMIAIVDPTTAPIITPNFVQQTIALLDPAAPLHQRSQKFELEAGELDAFAVHQYFVPRWIDRNRSSREPIACFFSSAASQDRLDPQNNFAGTEWFRHVIVRAAFKADDPVDLLCPRGQHQNWNVAGRCLTL